MTTAMLTDTVMSAPCGPAMLAQSSWPDSLRGLAYFGFIGAVCLLLLFFVILIIKQYKRCPSNRILVVYGKVGVNRASRCMHGGGGPGPSGPTRSPTI